ncbi:acyl-CoA dehydrogenase [Pendulispora brunnea]|uniref:Acyl-CoA dehydrogenase n=1 Tax=Pendulispora brunnea TaxID=2905690 RepID=A0ABZ2KBX3_9BACT
MNAQPLEESFGDPRDIENPLGFAQILAADERGELLAAGERALDEWNFNAEFVPVALGGRLHGLDDLARRIRTVFRRDAALALGYGVTSLMAAVNIWASGSISQQQQAAKLLLARQRIAVGYHELEHGNDFLSNELRARRDGTMFRLDGHKQVINNCARAAAMVLFARTNDAPGARSHSLLFVDTRALERDQVRLLPRYRTSAMRGCMLGGIEFNDCAVPHDSLLGREGSGVQTALRSFQITRAALPGMALGILDTGLRTVTAFATERRLYSTHVSELPHARNALAQVFVDLLIADCFARSVARGMHLFPEQASAWAASVKYLVPSMIEQAMNDLSIILGARFYLREGAHAIFGKHYRDVPVISLGHAGSTACLLTILPQLYDMACRGWKAAEAPAALFGHGEVLPPLDFSRLRIAGLDQDALASMLLVAAESDYARPGEEAIGQMIRSLAGELGQLAETARHMRPADRGVEASAAAFGVAERYPLLLAASACIHTWRQHRAHEPGHWLAGTEWIRAALTRLTQRIQGHSTALPREVVEPLFVELRDRVEHNRSCCLDGEPLKG